MARTNFYGWGPAYRRSFSDVILYALRTGETLTLFNDVTYTPILMEALVTAVHDLVDRKASGVFHVAGDDCISKHEFGVRMARTFGLSADTIVPVSINDKPGLVTRPRRMGLSNRKASAWLGRPLGGTAEHLATLARQEGSAAVKEIQAL